jgi:hypothetical protein
MIPREILKKIRPIELRPNRLVTAAAAERDCVRTPTGFLPKAQGCEERATLGHHGQNIFSRNAVAAISGSSIAGGICHNPVGVGANLNSFTQGSSCVATLDWRPESLWDSRMDANTVAVGSRRTQHAARGFHSAIVLRPSSFSPA